MLKQKSIDYSLLLISLLLYGFLGFAAKRHETLSLLLAYFAVFIIYLYIALKSDHDSITFWFYASILFRAVLLFSVPNLSDDFYRFLWDGHLLASGYHPFAEVPAFYMKHNLSIPGINEDLFLKLNSPDYFTVYPPLAQFIFWLAVKLSPQSLYGSLLVMKSIIFMAEMGSLWVIKKLLVHFEFEQARVLLYALNPLVILELMGNIHLEAVLIFFLLLSILLLYHQKLLLSGIVFSLAICVKLIPLIFLPALIPRLGWKKALQFYFIVAIACIIISVPLLDREIIFGFQNSLAYYFKKFEFNASIYYLVREWGYWYYGYNIIQTAGLVLGVVSFFIIVFVSAVNPWSIVRGPLLMPKSEGQSITHHRLSTIDYGLFITLTLILITYFLFTTTLHPWYITTLLVLSIFTEFRFTLLWTALIFLTYAGYTTNGFQENLWITTIEYISVLGYLAYELLWKRKYFLSQAP